MGFKVHYKDVTGNFSNGQDIPEYIARKRLGDGVVDKMKLNYDVGKKNETGYAKYTYTKDDPLVNSANWKW